MICIHLVHTTRQGFVENGKNIFCQTLKKYLELDIINESPTEIFIAECKGYQPYHLISFQEIKEWLDNTTHIRKSLISMNEEQIAHRNKMEKWARNNARN